MSVSDFLRPRLDGKRFESHSIPLELLGDLAVLETMIVEVAKWKYLQKNPGRKRVPRKFSEGVSLNLTGVGEGSAIANICLIISAPSLFPADQFPGEHQVYFEEAREAIISAINAAEENTPPTAHLPAKSLAYFDRFGRNLRPGEVIEFTSSTLAGTAKLTRETRLRLLKAAEVAEHTEEIHIRGGVHAINQEEMVFEIILSDGTKIPGPMTEQHIDGIMDALNLYRKGFKVLLDGVGRFNKNDRLQKIESVEHITLLDPLDFQTRMEELKSLKDGWYDGLGIAPPADKLDQLAGDFNDYYPDTLPSPYVYPVAEGGIRLEWSLGQAEVSVEVDFTNYAGTWHALHLQTDEEDAKVLQMATKADWEWMVKKLQEIGETHS